MAAIVQPRFHPNSEAGECRAPASGLDIDCNEDRYVLYKKGPFMNNWNYRYNYYLTQEYSIQTDIKTDRDWLVEVPSLLDGKGKVLYKSSKLTLNKDGFLIISENFSWNGPTGSYPFDCMIRGSCVHDAFYTLFSKRFGNGKLSAQNDWKPKADCLLKEHFIEDGCSEGIAADVETIVKYGSKFVEE